MTRKALYWVLVLVFLSCGTVAKTIKFQMEVKSFEKTIIDKRDNSEYGVIEIEGQKWFAENLRFKSPKSICYRRKEINCINYGRLYSYDELEMACPKGWRVPNIKDWETLKSNFHNDSIYALLDTSNWEITEKHSNKSGFTLQGVGYQMEKKLFLGEGKATTIWINQMNKFDEFYHVHIYGGEGIYFEKSDFHTNEIFHAHPIEDLKNRRFSIRCICDKN